jgi:hypothetical protein
MIKNGGPLTLLSLRVHSVPPTKLARSPSWWVFYVLDPQRVTKNMTHCHTNNLVVSFIFRTFRVVEGG